MHESRAHGRRIATVTSANEKRGLPGADELSKRRRAQRRRRLPSALQAVPFSSGQPLEGTSFPSRAQGRDSRQDASRTMAARASRAACTVSGVVKPVTHPGRSVRPSPRGTSVGRLLHRISRSHPRLGAPDSHFRDHRRAAWIAILEGETGSEHPHRRRSSGRCRTADLSPAIQHPLIRHAADDSGIEALAASPAGAVCFWRQ